MSHIYKPNIVLNKLLEKNTIILKPLQQLIINKTKNTNVKPINILNVDNTGCLYVNSINIQDNVIGVDKYGLLTMPDTAPPIN